MALPASATLLDKAFSDSFGLKQTKKRTKGRPAKLGPDGVEIAPAVTARIETSGTEGVHQCYLRERRQAKNDRIGRLARIYVQKAQLGPLALPSSWRTEVDSDEEVSDCFFFKHEGAAGLFDGLFNSDADELTDRRVLSIYQVACLDQAVKAKASGETPSKAMVSQGKDAAIANIAAVIAEEVSRKMKRSEAELDIDQEGRRHPCSCCFLVDLHKWPSAGGEEDGNNDEDGCRTPGDPTGEDKDQGELMEDGREEQPARGRGVAGSRAVQADQEEPDDTGAERRLSSAKADDRLEFGEEEIGEEEVGEEEVGEEEVGEEEAGEEEAEEEEAEEEEAEEEESGEEEAGEEEAGEEEAGEEEAREEEAGEEEAGEEEVGEEQVEEDDDETDLAPTSPSEVRSSPTKSRSARIRSPITDKVYEIVPQEPVRPQREKAAPTKLFNLADMMVAPKRTRNSAKPVGKSAKPTGKPAKPVGKPAKPTGKPTRAAVNAAKKGAPAQRVGRSGRRG